MKIKLSFIFAIIVSIILISGGLNERASAQPLQDFSFESFNADYYLDRNYEKASTMRVQETLVALFPDYDQNHGILRAIPESYKGHTLSLKNISVTNESGTPYRFTSYGQDGNKVLKIGDPGHYAHGRTIYNINYELQDVTTYYKDHDELFWDINGDQWGQTFNTVTANIHIAKDLVGSLQDQRRCYVGSYGSTAQNCSITLVSPPNDSYVTVSANNVLAGQTLTAVLSFKPGTFQKSSALKKEEHQRRVKMVLGISGAAVPPFAAFLFMFRRWRQFGDDPKGRGVIIPEYEPPKEVDVLKSDFLLKQQLRSVAVTALIVDMAVKGNVIINEIPKKGFFGKNDYELEVKNIPADLSKQESDALKIIFDDALVPGGKVKLSEIKKSQSANANISNVKEALFDQKNKKGEIDPSAVKKLSSGRQAIYQKLQDLENDLAAALTAQGYFIKDPKKVKNGYRVWSGILFFGVLFFGWMAGGLNQPFLTGFVVGIALAAIIIFMFSNIMPAKTEAGVASYDALLGLKDYIKMAEADRIRFLQSPEGAEKIANKDSFDPQDPTQKVKLFENLLPYAMLFGQEKQWAKQFEDIYTTPPDWYRGGNWSSFNAGYLVSSLGDFNSASSTSFASPSSSSGSGFSGGGAGGGGGGGGGGGW
jgi:uncharacterized membrane protein YgcG